MATKLSKITAVGEVEKGDDKPNSRVTKAHVGQMLEALNYALDGDVDGYIRLGYLSFAVATVLRDIGYPGPHKALSAKMWANFGKGVEGGK